MAHFDMHDMKKHASFYLREKVKSVRLALTSVSPIQLLAEDATNADPWGPETSTMAKLSEAAFELEEYERIVQVLHSRLDPNAKRPWRQLFKTLTVLEYLLTHGPGSLSNEFKADADSIEELCQYNHIDQQGIDRGVGIRNKADHVLELLSKADVWKEERSRAQKISNGIHGFGSSIHRANVAATEGEENWTIKSNSTELKDAESESLLSDEGASREAKATMSSQAEWKPFEKCASIPSYLRNDDDGSSHVSDDQWKASATSPYGKCLSSPSLFHGASPPIWQAFPSEMNKESTHISEAGKETENLSPFFLQALNDADKDATPSGDVVQMKFPDATNVPPPHLSMRQLFHFHKPSSHEKHHTKDRDAVVMEKKVVAQALRTPLPIATTMKKPGKTSGLPVIPPPPPPSKFRARIQRHFQASNLIDL